MNNAGKFFFGAGVGCAAMIGLFFFGIIALAIVTPADDAMPGSAMADSDLDALLELGLLRADEEIIYFYSPGVFDVTEGGSFFTEKRVVAYTHGDAEATLEQATYQEIAAIDVDYSESWLDDTVIVATRHDGTEILLGVTNTERADRRFFNRLVREWKQQTGGGQQGPAEQEQEAAEADL